MLIMECYNLYYDLADENFRTGHTQLKTFKMFFEYLHKTFLKKIRPTCKNVALKHKSRIYSYSTSLGAYGS